VNFSEPSSKKKKKVHKHHKRKAESADGDDSREKKRKLSSASVESIANTKRGLFDESNKQANLDTCQTGQNLVHMDTESILSDRDILGSSDKSVVGTCSSKPTEISNNSVTPKEEKDTFVMPDTFDLNKRNSNTSRSQLGDLPVENCRNSSVNTQSTIEKPVCLNASGEHIPQTPKDQDISLFSSFTDSIASSGQSICRQNSDTIDSGVYSPVSEKSSGLAVKTEAPSNSFGGAILPLLMDEGKVHNRGKQWHFYLHWGYGL